MNALLGGRLFRVHQERRTKMKETIVVKDWKEAAKIVTGLDDAGFDKLYAELQEMKSKRPHHPKKIQLCCPDMNLAIEEGFMKVVKNLSYMSYDEVDWDVDFCPFCGKEIVLIQSSNQTARNENVVR